MTVKKAKLKAIKYEEPKHPNPIFEALRATKRSTRDRMGKFYAPYEEEFVRDDVGQTDKALFAVHFLMNFYLDIHDDGMPTIMAAAFADIISECAEQTALHRAQKDAVTKAGLKLEEELRPVRSR
jgi:hypothetical protein